jgi:hypothetical protein
MCAAVSQATFWGCSKRILLHRIAKEGRTVEDGTMTLWNPWISINLLSTRNLVPFQNTLSYCHNPRHPQKILIFEVQKVYLIFR